MEENKTIRIECEGSTTVTLDELKELHHYKERTREHYEKFKASVLRLGFKFPIFFWEDMEGTKWIVDAHGRKQFLMEMRASEGYNIPPLPAVRIFAKDKKEAKEAVLAQESVFGKILEEPLYEFINEEGFELDESDLSTFTEIYELDMEFNNEPAKTGDEEQQSKEKACQLCTAYHSRNHTNE